MSVSEEYRVIRPGEGKYAPGGALRVSSPPLTRERAEALAASLGGRVERRVVGPWSEVRYTAIFTCPRCGGPTRLLAEREGEYTCADTHPREVMTEVPDTREVAP